MLDRVYTLICSRSFGIARLPRCTALSDLPFLILIGSGCAHSQTVLMESQEGANSLMRHRRLGRTKYNGGG